MTVGLLTLGLTCLTATAESVDISVKDTNQSPHTSNILNIRSYDSKQNLLNSKNITISPGATKTVSITTGATYMLVGQVNATVSYQILCSGPSTSFTLAYKGCTNG